MNTYVIFYNSSESLYVRASSSDAAIRWAERRFPGIRVNAWGIATSLPRWATIHNA